MLHVDLDQKNLLAILSPDGVLDRRDFEAAAKEIDPLIERAGKLNGLIIYVEKFPGWDSFAALRSHFHFVKEHHKHIKRIAFVTDSAIGDLAEKVASHFVAAEIKLFPYSELSEAKTWIASS